MQLPARLVDPFLAMRANPNDPNPKASLCDHGDKGRVWHLTEMKKPPKEEKADMRYLGTHERGLPARYAINSTAWKKRNRQKQYLAKRRKDAYTPKQRAFPPSHAEIRRMKGEAA